jgi:hypothetical protein
MPGNQLRQDVRPWYQKINDAARYYLGPAYEPIEMAGNAFAALSPGADMIDMQQESDKLMRSHGGWDTVNAGLGLAKATMGMAIPGTAKGISEGVDEAAKGIRAYHGSPHDFDQFSMDKIGTGEGAQSYGHGLYFAGNEDVAKSYRDMVPKPDRSAMVNVATKVKAAGQDPAEMLPVIFPKASAEEISAAIAEAANPPPGHMYEVNINASPDDFLDWDKPLSEQSEKVRGGVRSAYGPVPDNAKFGSYDLPGKPEPVHTKMMKDAGIPGIRYLDQGSRGPHIPAGVSDAAGDVVKYWLGQAGNDGNKAADMLLAHDPSATEVAGILRSQSWKPKETHNYVVFDPRMIEILRKYGILGAAGIGGAAYGNALRSDREKT